MIALKWIGLILGLTPLILADVATWALDWMVDLGRLKPRWLKYHPLDGGPKEIG